MGNIFKEVKLKSQFVEKFKRCDWADPTDVAFYISEMRSTERSRILDELCSDRICRFCGKLKINSKSWVISKDKKKVMCRSCHMRKIPDRTLEKSSKLNLKIFTIAQRYKINAQKLSLARVRASISISEFASFAGWMASYQYKLENGSTKTVSAETAETILEVFARFGFYTEDEL